MFRVKAEDAAVVAGVGDPEPETLFVDGLLFQLVFLVIDHKTIQLLSEEQTVCDDVLSASF